LAGIDSHRLAPWSLDRIVSFTLPLDRIAERDQEDAPVEQAHPANSALRKSDAVSPVPESVLHEFRSSPSEPAWLSPVPTQRIGREKGLLVAYPFPPVPCPRPLPHHAGSQERFHTLLRHRVTHPPHR